MKLTRLLLAALLVASSLITIVPAASAQMPDPDQLEQCVNGIATPGACDGFAGCLQQIPAGAEPKPDSCNDEFTAFVTDFINNSPCSFGAPGEIPDCPTPAVPCPVGGPGNVPECDTPSLALCDEPAGVSDPVFQAMCAVANAIDTIVIPGVGAFDVTIQSNDEDEDGRADVAKVQLTPDPLPRKVPAAAECTGPTPTPAAPTPAPNPNCTDGTTPVVVAPVYMQLDFFYTPAGTTAPYGAPTGSGFDYAVTGVMVYSPSTGILQAASHNAYRFTDHYLGDANNNHFGIYSAAGSASEPAYGACQVCIDVDALRVAVSAGPAVYGPTSATPGMLIPNNGFALDLDLVNPTNSTEMAGSSITERSGVGFHDTASLAVLNFPALAGTNGPTTGPANFPDGNGLDFSYIHVKWPGARDEPVDPFAAYTYSNLDDDQDTDYAELTCDQATNPTNPNAWCGDYDGDGVLNGVDSEPTSPNVLLDLTFDPIPAGAGEEAAYQAAFRYTCRGTIQAGTIKLERSIDGAAFVQDTTFGSKTCGVTTPAPLGSAAVRNNPDAVDHTVAYRLKAVSSRSVDSYSAPISFTLLANTQPTGTYARTCEPPAGPCPTDNNAGRTVAYLHEVTGVTSGEASQTVSVRFADNRGHNTLDSSAPFEQSFDYVPGSSVIMTITVADSGGASLVIPDSFTVPTGVPPTIGTLSPSSGPVAGGTSVTIPGTGFLAGATVSIGGTAATVTGNTATSLTVTTPAHVAGTVDVTVNNPDGHSITSAGGFTYNNPPNNAPTVASGYPKADEDINTGGKDVVDIYLLVRDDAAATGLSASIDFQVGSGSRTSSVMNKVTCGAPPAAGPATPTGPTGLGERGAPVPGNERVGGIWCAKSLADRANEQLFFKEFVYPAAGANPGDVIAYRFNFTDGVGRPVVPHTAAGADFTHTVGAQVAKATNPNQICVALAAPGTFPACLTANLPDGCDPQALDAVKCAQTNDIVCADGESFAEADRCVPVECTGTDPLACADALALVCTGTETFQANLCLPAQCVPDPESPDAAGCAEALALPPECNALDEGFTVAECASVTGLVCSATQTLQDKCVPAPCISGIVDQAMDCLVAIACPAEFYDNFDPSYMPCVIIIPPDVLIAMLTCGEGESPPGDVPGDMCVIPNVPDVPEECAPGQDPTADEPCIPQAPENVRVPNPILWFFGGCNGLQDVMDFVLTLTGTPSSQPGCGDIRDDSTLSPLAQSVQDAIEDLDPNAVLDGIPATPGDEATWRDSDGRIVFGDSEPNGQVDQVERFLVSYDQDNGRTTAHFYTPNGLTPPSGESQRVSIGDSTATIGTREVLVIRNGAQWTCAYTKVGEQTPIALHAGQGATEAAACASNSLTSTDLFVDAGTDHLIVRRATDEGGACIVGFTRGDPTIYDSTTCSNGVTSGPIGATGGLLHPCPDNPDKWCRTVEPHQDPSDPAACIQEGATPNVACPMTPRENVTLPDDSGSPDACGIDDSLPSCENGCDPTTDTNYCLPVNVRDALCAQPVIADLEECGGDGVQTDPCEADDTTPTCENGCDQPDPQGCMPEGSPVQDGFVARIDLPTPAIDATLPYAPPVLVSDGAGNLHFEADVYALQAGEWTAYAGPVSLALQRDCEALAALGVDEFATLCMIDGSAAPDYTIVVGSLATNGHHEFDVPASDVRERLFAVVGETPLPVSAIHVWIEAGSSVSNYAVPTRLALGSAPDAPSAGMLGLVDRVDDQLWHPVPLIAATAPEPCTEGVGIDGDCTSLPEPCAEGVGIDGDCTTVPVIVAPADGFVARITLPKANNQADAAGPSDAVPVIVLDDANQFEADIYSKVGAAWQAFTGSANLVLQRDCQVLAPAGEDPAICTTTGDSDFTVVIPGVAQATAGHYRFQLDAAEARAKLFFGAPATAVHIWIEAGDLQSNYALPTALLLGENADARPTDATLEQADALDAQLWHPVPLVDATTPQPCDTGIGVDGDCTQVPSQCDVDDTLPQCANGCEPGQQQGPLGCVGLTADGFVAGFSMTDPVSGMGSVPVLVHQGDEDLIITVAAYERAADDYVPYAADRVLTLHIQLNCGELKPALAAIANCEDDYPVLYDSAPQTGRTFTVPRSALAAAFEPTDAFAPYFADGYPLTALNVFVNDDTPQSEATPGDDARYSSFSLQTNALILAGAEDIADRLDDAGVPFTPVVVTNPAAMDSIEENVPQADGFVARIDIPNVQQPDTSDGSATAAPILVPGGSDELSFEADVYTLQGAAWTTYDGPVTLNLQRDCEAIAALGDEVLADLCATDGSNAPDHTVIVGSTGSNEAGHYHFDVPAADVRDRLFPTLGETVLPASAIHVWIEADGKASNYAFPTRVALGMHAEGQPDGQVLGLVDMVDAQLWHPVPLLDASAVPSCGSPQAAAPVDTDGDGTIDTCDATDDTDTDSDGVPDTADNCDATANADQVDTNDDAEGDACDPDDDGDSQLDGADNCPLVSNTNQLDADGDGLGDACDTDDDNDTVADGVDNCAFVANLDQADTNGDGIGDACDADNDGVGDSTDNCPAVANTDQLNTDSAADGGDACDTDDDNDGKLDGEDLCPIGAATGLDTDGDGCIDAGEDSDDDNDTVADGSDNCILTANTDQLNTDDQGDGGDACDTDDDDDGDLDGADNCPVVANANQLDTDGDLQGDACDTDDDNDSFSDADEATAGSDPLVAASTPDDTEGDGVPNTTDNCPAVANADQLNTDGAADGGNACDTDDDNDGKLDTEEGGVTGTSPVNNDTDADGYSDGSADPDGTGPIEAGDNCPAVANPTQADADSDGIGDACEAPDTDADGIIDSADNCPAIANAAQTDTNDDGEGDACDQDDDGDGVDDVDDLCPSDGAPDDPLGMVVGPAMPVLNGCPDQRGVVLCPDGTVGLPQADCVPVPEPCDEGYGLQGVQCVPEPTLCEEGLGLTDVACVPEPALCDEGVGVDGVQCVGIPEQLACVEAGPVSCLEAPFAIIEQAACEAAGDAEGELPGCLLGAPDSVLAAVCGELGVCDDSDEDGIPDVADDCEGDPLSDECPAPDPTEIVFGEIGCVGGEPVGVPGVLTVCVAEEGGFYTSFLGLPGVRIRIGTTNISL